MNRDMGKQSEDRALRHWLVNMIWEGGLATVFITLTGGAFLTGLALYLGANDFEIGLLAAIPFILQILQLPSAYLIELTGRRKTITVWGSVLGRQICWLVLPLIFLSGNWRLAALILVVTIASAAIMPATVGWMSWMADLVPERIRGRYFGSRNIAVAISATTTSLLGGYVLDHFRAQGQESIGFSIIVGGGCLFALAAVILLSRVPDRKVIKEKMQIGWSYLAHPIKDKNFRHLLKVFVGWNLAIGIAAPFFAAHMISNLKMSFTQIAFYSVLFNLAVVMFNKIWGRAVDRFGCKPVAVFCAFGISLIPMIWWIPRPDSYGILYFEAAYSGILWAGFNLAAFNIPIVHSPKSERTVYLAMFAMLCGLGFFISSLLGGILAESWNHIRWTLGPQTIVNYHILFAVSSLLRLVAAAYILTFRESGDKAIPAMIGYIGSSVMKWFSDGQQIFIDIIKRK
jgi:MFS family permease